MLQSDIVAYKVILIIDYLSGNKFLLSSRRQPLTSYARSRGIQPIIYSKYFANALSNADNISLKENVSLPVLFNLTRIRL